jgi:D-serine deaminase-like pyridoxal phosphate-dependent protein
MDLDTPALLVDLDRMERNIARWQRLADDADVAFRVHVKTHKVPAIAKKQLAAGARGIVCAKVSEAEVFVDAGCDDVVVAFPVFGSEKWRRLAALAERARIGVNVDSDEAIEGIGASARAVGVTIEAYLDVDVGMHRGGVAFDQFDEAARLAALIERTRGLELAGVTTYSAVGARDADTAGREESERLVTLAEELRGRGLEIREVAAGGSVSGPAVAAASGITELRAGTYVFCDLMQVEAGAATWADVALTALCTVVSTRRPDRATVDGGVKTFSADHRANAGYARALERDVTLERLSEEHGLALVGAGELVRLGEKIRFVPAHVCTAVNLSDELYGLRGDEVEVVWPVAARGKRT